MNRYAFVEKATKEKEPPKPKPTKKEKAISKSLPRHIANDRSVAAETMRQAALNILAHQDVRVIRQRRPRPQPRRTVSGVNRRLMPPAIVCMTGTGPLSRTDLIDTLEQHGYTYNNNPARAQILVFNPDQTARESVKFRNARRNQDVAMVTYDTFFRRMLDLDVTED